MTGQTTLETTPRRRSPGAREATLSESPRPDRELVEAARRGDRGAFEELYRSHVGLVYALCLRLVADRAEAESHTQDVFVRAWRKLETYRGDGPFGAWLCRIARNVVIEEKRGESRRNRFFDRGREVEQLEGTPGRSAREGFAARSDAAIDLERAIATLPDGARRVFVLHDVEGYGHDEIAAMMRCAGGTVRSQIHRARRLLRERLERGGAS